MSHTNNIQNNKSSNDKNMSISIHLEALNSEYKNLLIKYQQAVANYTNYLKEQSDKPCEGSSDLSGDQKCWATIKGQAFWGVSGISQSNVNSVEECSALCSTTNGCSGATYNPNQNTCLLRKGEGSSIPAAGSYAIVPKGKKLLQIIDFLNNRLTNINDQIQKLIEKGESIYDKQSVARTQQSQNLIKNYRDLVKEKIHISKMLDNYEDASQEVEEGDLRVTQNYYSYILLTILAIIVVYILFKLSVTFTSNSNNSYNSYNSYSGFQTGGQLSKNTYYIVFFIIFLSVFIYHYFK
jgi:hypothetical protein